MVEEAVVVVVVEVEVASPAPTRQLLDEAVGDRGSMPWASPRIFFSHKTSFEHGPIYHIEL